MPPLTQGIDHTAERRVIDPTNLNEPQRLGLACASCGKRWPRPRNLLGQLPDSTPVLGCDDCASSPAFLGGDGRAV